MGEEKIAGALLGKQNVEAGTWKKKNTGCVRCKEEGTMYNENRKKEKKEVGLNRLGVLNKKNRKKTRTAPRSEEVGVMQRSFLEKKNKK